MKTAYLITAALAGVCLPALAHARAREEMVISGGPIITMAGEAPELAEAIAVSDGRIVALGSRVEVARAVSRKAKQLDLKGRTLLPGFIDAHGHLSYVGQSAGMAQLAPPPVGKVNSIAAVQDALKAYAAALPQTAPIVGNGYDDSQLAERRHPTRADLDAVSADKPILVIHASGHFAVMNSAMLKLAGIGPDTPDPAGGVIRREADGRTPNGVLEETAFFTSMTKIMPASSEAGVKALIAGQKVYVANGITTAQDGRVMPEGWPALAELAKRSTSLIDTVALISDERDWPGEVRSLIGKDYAGRVRIGGVKLTIDGSPQGRTAWLHDPVTIPPAGKGVDYRGYPAIDLGLFNARLKAAADNGWPVFVHVNGDEAMQALIDGVRANGLSGQRTIAIHAQVTRLDQLEAMKALDIQPSFFASHTWFWGDWHRDAALGPKRADFISPQATARRIGLRPSAHNDSPVVPPDIMRLIWSSVNRRTQSGDILGPLERIPVYDALRQVTIDAAWQIREDAKKGSIAPGKLADFVVLDTNPLAADPARLADIKVLATIKEGRTVFGNLDK